MAAGAPGAGQILVVDDDDDFRMVLAATFEHLGYQVQTACNGQQALAALQKHAFQIVVSDIRMPNGDGIELLEKSRTSLQNVPVVLLLTGFADITTEEAYKKGATALFSKPFDSQKLTEMVQRLVNVGNNPPARRLPIATQLSADLYFHGSPQALDAQVMNLNEGGMYLALPHEKCPNVNDEVRFNVHFDGAKKFTGEGIIRWANIKDSPNLPAGCGLEFLHQTNKELSKVLSYIKSVSPP